LVNIDADKKGFTTLLKKTGIQIVGHDGPMPESGQL